MSASADLQALIVARLGRTADTVLGDGAAMVFPIVHGLGMESLPAVRVAAGGTALVLGTDYDVEKADNNTLRVLALGAAPGPGAWVATVACLRVAVPIVERRTRELGAEIEAAAARQGLCIYVMPPLPTRAMQHVPFVFFEVAEVKVRIIERAAMNGSGADAYDLWDDVAASLHWQLFGTILSHPLQLAARPSDIEEDPADRVMDVIFEATYGLNPTAT